MVGMPWLKWESGVLRALCEMNVRFYGKSELFSRLVFLEGKLRFFRRSRKGGWPFWSADWSAGGPVDVVLGMDGQYGSIPDVGKCRVHIVHGLNITSSYFNNSSSNRGEARFIVIFNSNNEFYFIDKIK